MTEKNILVVYYSSRTENTHRFVQKAGLKNTHRLEKGTPPPTLDEKYILICPSYGGGAVEGSIPPEVYALLNKETNRNNLLGVIGAGNTNFGTAYCQAAKMISEKCKVPLLYTFELLGNIDDVNRIKRGVQHFGKD